MINNFKWYLHSCSWINKSFTGALPCGPKLQTHALYYIIIILLKGRVNPSKNFLTVHCICPVTVLIEPEVTTDNINQTMSEIIIINLNSSMTSGGRTFDIDLPQISMNNGPFRLVCRR